MRFLLLLPLIFIISCKGFSPLNPMHENSNEKEEVSSLTPEMGGSNYAFIELGRYASEPNETHWFEDVKTPVAHYHLYVEKVRKQLDAMSTNGQRKIALPIWFGGSDTSCVTWAHTICPHNGKLPVQIKKNLQDLIQEISLRKFTEIQLRLGGQGLADVNGWSEFREDYYQSNLSFMIDVIDTAELSLKNKNLTVFYDLGLELMGHPYIISKPWLKEYLRRVWAYYIQNYDVQKTVGFSFNHAHRDATYESLKLFDDSGVRPPRLAFDIYVDRPKHLQNIQWILQLRGWGKDYPIFIQETYRSEKTVAFDVKDAIENLQLNIRTIMQWPLDVNASGHSNSTDYHFDAYR